MRLPTGAEFVLPRDSQFATEVFVTNADVDWGSEALLCRFADRNRDFLDIGANIGYYACYLSPLVRRSYAFEPDPRNLRGLRQNVGRAGNIEIVEAAVSSRTGTAKLRLGAGGAVSTLEPGAGAAVEVPITTIDDFIRTRPDANVALVKIDIEGHDIEALRGMPRLIERDQPLILIECLSIELMDICRAWGYRTFAFVCEPPDDSYRLHEIGAADVGVAAVKMVFLVPGRLSRTFADIAGKRSR